jgi:hypothetical protein
MRFSCANASRFASRRLRHASNTSSAARARPPRRRRHHRHARRDAIDLIGAQRAQLGEGGEAGLDLAERLVVQPLPGRGVARTQVDQRDAVAGPRERDRDAAPHAAGTDRGEARPRRSIRCQSPSCRRCFSAAGVRLARPSASSVRGPLRRSRPRKPPTIASRPCAIGASTPA